MFNISAHWKVFLISLLALSAIYYATGTMNSHINAGQPIQQADGQGITNKAGSIEQAARAPETAHPTSAQATPKPFPTTAMSNAFPSGLQEHAQRALEKRDGKASIELANLIGRCPDIAAETESARSALVLEKNLAVQAYVGQQLRDLQWLSSECNNLGSKSGRLRIDLLHVAMRDGQSGAAAALYFTGTFDTEVANSLGRDATNGDLLSLSLVAGGVGRNSGLTGEDVKLARAALLAASKDPSLSEVGATYLHNARKIASTQAAMASSDPKAQVQKVINGIIPNFPATILDAEEAKRVGNILEAIKQKRHNLATNSHFNSVGPQASIQDKLGIRA